jgi:hypothetical protein
MLQFGLVAEEVEKMNPDLVVRDSEGKPYAVRYDAVNAMLLNEFLKRHRSVSDVKSRIAQLAARLDEQDSKIQEINEQWQTIQIATTREIRWMGRGPRRTLVRITLRRLFLYRVVWPQSVDRSLG